MEYLGQLKLSWMCLYIHVCINTKQCMHTCVSRVCIIIELLCVNIDAGNMTERA